MRLLGAEARRLAARRVFRYLLLAGLAVLASGSAARVRLKVTDPAAATAVLAEAGLTAAGQDGWLMVSGAIPSEVNRLLGERGIWADELGPDHADLEDVFLSLTQATQAPAEAPQEIPPA